MTDAAYTAWRADREYGLVSVLVAETRDDVSALNLRARADLILDGTLKPGREVELNDGTAAGVGDTIITRRNDRRLRNGKDWVRNGDTWTITSVRDDGSVAIRKTGRRFGGSIVLPASYVADHIDLGYAITARRAQGVTVDTAHVLVEPTTTRENFYVAMTRGKHSNRAYVILDRADEHAHPHPGDNADATGRSVLFGVLQHVGAELSARETITAEQEQWGSIAQLAAEYETIAAAAQRDRWATLIRSSGLTVEQADAAIESEAVRGTHRPTAPRRGQPPQPRHLAPAPCGRARVHRRRRHRLRPALPRRPYHRAPGRLGSHPQDTTADRRTDPVRRRPDDRRYAAGAR